MHPVGFTIEMYVLVLVIQHKIRTRHFHLWLGRLYDIFPHYLTKGTIFEKKIIELKMCLDFLYNFCLKYFSF
jgi:hypothetical protein